MLTRKGNSLLIQGEQEKIDSNLPEVGCLPLAERKINLQGPGPLFRILAIFLAAVILASTGVVHVAVAFTLGVFLMVVTDEFDDRPNPNARAEDSDSDGDETSRIEQETASADP